MAAKKKTEKKPVKTKSAPKAKSKKGKNRFFSILKKIVLGFLILSILSTIIYRFVPVPLTPLMVIRTVGMVFDKDQEVRCKKEWVSIDKISKNMQIAVIASEDNNFRRHHGLDFGAIDKAKAYNEKNKGKRKRGASTITQQTAKNVFLTPDRTWIRKGFELYFTGLIELCWSKKRIMEVYLNVIEFGNGIYGIEAASQFYYRKSADKLTKREAAMLASIIPDPRRRNPVKPTAYINGRCNAIMDLMGKVAPIKW